MFNPSTKNKARTRFVEAMSEDFSISMALDAYERERWIVHPIERWHEDFGDVMWVKVPQDELPYIGSPLDDNWPGYHKFWCQIPTLYLPIEAL